MHALMSVMLLLTLSLSVLTTQVDWSTPTVSDPAPPTTTSQPGCPGFETALNRRRSCIAYQLIRSLRTLERATYRCSSEMSSLGTPANAIHQYTKKNRSHSRCHRRLRSKNHAATPPQNHAVVEAPLRAVRAASSSFSGTMVSYPETRFLLWLRHFR